jgi:hypothetical protein
MIAARHFSWSLQRSVRTPAGVASDRHRTRRRTWACSPSRRLGAPRASSKPSASTLRAFLVVKCP